MRIRNGFEEFFCLRSNLSNDNIISANRPGLKTDVENYIFWSERGSGFRELGGTPPPRIPKHKGIRKIQKNVYNIHSRDRSWEHFWMKKVKINFTTPGHGMLLHTRDSFLLPTQFAPPKAGGGLVQDRVRSWDPPPQVNEQEPQALHSVQFPSTAES